MPDWLLDSGSSFDKSKILLSKWLRDNLGHVQSLQEEELIPYGVRKFISGWEVQIPKGNENIILHVLVDSGFPYSPIRIAYKNQNVYIVWPHVENEGLLCLPKVSPPSAGLQHAIATSLADALHLISQCQSPAFVEGELRREFISYWDRSNDKTTKNIRSLLDQSKKNARKIAVWYGESFNAVAEDKDQLLSWLQNRGRTEESLVYPGIFAFLASAPTPPFPSTPIQLFTLLKESCPSIDAVLAHHPIEKQLLITLGVESKSGVGFISFHLSKPELDGFRKNKTFQASIKKQLWKQRSKLTRQNVVRYDSSWIHGRGLDANHTLLRNSDILILGCGSLGSQVAMRLAQAGIGAMTLVDPDTMATANVGRHTLGIDSVGKSKAKSLASLLLSRYPHMRKAEGKHLSWQAFFDESPETFKRSNLVVACLGDWPADGQLAEWQIKAKPSCPVIYGWLDEQGSASHSLALLSSGPSLSCVLGSDGKLRIPETLWTSDNRLQTEPACGTYFQPYGPIDVLHAESLVARLCIGILTGKIKAPTHRVYACATEQLREVGGEWSSEHLRNRPANYDGPFEYERIVSFCGICSDCLGAA